MSNDVVLSYVLYTLVLCLLAVLFTVVMVKVCAVREERREDRKRRARIEEQHRYYRFHPDLEVRLAYTVLSSALDEEHHATTRVLEEWQRGTWLGHRKAVEKMTAAADRSNEARRALAVADHAYEVRAL